MHSLSFGCAPFMADRNPVFPRDLVGKIIQIKCRDKTDNAARNALNGKDEIFIFEIDVEGDFTPKDVPAIEGKTLA